MKKLDFNRKIKKHWPAEPVLKLSETEQEKLFHAIKDLLREKKAVIVAHYYTDPIIQRLAEATGGFVGDSLEMARFGAEHSAGTLLVAGVRFMGESAKILSPKKRVLMPDLGAECSLDLGCDPKEFKKLCEANPDRVVVVYANTSAEIKALADWTVTSSIAVDVVRHLVSLGKKILWAPDRYLGDYIQRQTGADMLLWDACCIVHAEFDAERIRELKTANPDAELLVHPESQPEVIALADIVGSTSQLLHASQKRLTRKFIVATESGILYQMKKASPDKEFIMAPARAQGDEFICDNVCPWMKMNNLQNIFAALKNETGEVLLAEETIQKALVPLTRMLEFTKEEQLRKTMKMKTAIVETVKIALHEDLQGQTDVTALLIPEKRQASARVLTREDMVLCGKDWVNEVFRQLDPRVTVSWNYADGDEIAADCVIYTLEGNARSLLTGERTALNFLQTLSGVATATNRFAKLLAGSGTRLLDTRKTIPGLRTAQKYAVKCGGGLNHRMGLYDAFLIKENHIAACGSITEAIRAAREIAPGKSVEIEVENIEGLQEAIAAKADIVMLDNFPLERIKEAVRLNASRVKLEVSGDVNLGNIASIGETGVDFVSVGSLTKHVYAINLSMRFDMRIK